MKEHLDKNTSLVLKNYKDPLKPVPKSEGFGYYGAVLMTLDGEKMQCALCGGLYADVGSHSRQAHKISHTQYREKFQLARETSLISEAERERRKARTLQWLMSLTPEQRAEQKEKTRQAAKEWRAKNPNTAKPIRLETKNKRGTCPDQLVAKIQEVAKQLGKTPSKNEFILACGGQRYMHLIYKTFGSWLKALERAKLNALPHNSNKGKKIRHTRYEDEELLEILSDFYLNHGTIPTYTDFRRGLIPNPDKYVRRFGSMQAARERAGITETPINISTLRKGKTLTQLRAERE